MTMENFFKNGDKIYFIEYPELIKEGTFSEYWDCDCSYIMHQGKSITIETCKIFSNEDNAKSYIREQKIHRKVFIKNEIKRLTKELESL